MNESLAKKLVAGDRRALGRAITLVESRVRAHREQGYALLSEVMPMTGRSIRLGVSGAPGVGKSTFIESFGLKLIAKGLRIAVLAIDPSSPISKGSILGDKTRMQLLSSHAKAFIRPSPAGRNLGGVAKKTRESMLLCEAAGYDLILIETVGVGQSEYTVRSMVDAFVYLQLPNAGDDLQGIKKGILELANFILINKADGKNKLAAKRAKVDLDLALNLIYQKKPDLKPSIRLISALEDQGIDTLIADIFSYIEQRKNSGDLESSRSKQSVTWFEEEVTSGILELIRESATYMSSYSELIEQVKTHRLAPIEAAKSFVSSLTLTKESSK